MGVPELNESDFGLDSLNMRSRVLVYVGSDDCHHCRVFFPIFNEYAAKNPRVRTAYLNLKKMSSRFMERLDYIIPGLQGIPAIYVFNNGVPGTPFSGERTTRGIGEFVAQFYN